MYRKEILYLYLFRHGEKESCVGFLKSEEKRDGHLVMLQVKNISDNLAGTFPIRIRNNLGWQEVGQVQLCQGCGNWQQKGTESFAEVEIPLSDEYRIRGRSKEQSGRQVTEQTGGLNKRQAIEQIDSLNKRQAIEQIDSLNKRQTMEQIDSLGKRQTSVLEDSANKNLSIVRVDDQSQEKNSAQTVLQRPEPKLTAASESYPTLWEDKWEQLLHSYDQIHPYGDDRTYIKLEPKDFTVLRSGYQHLVNNSFLLHGFYNYRYLILGKEKDFYIGVPGVFYEREKMVAMMFGFEAFECEGGAAEEGKFGYYLRKVEL